MNDTNEYGLSISFYLALLPSYKFGHVHMKKIQQIQLTRVLLVHTPINNIKVLLCRIAF